MRCCPTTSRASAPRKRRRDSTRGGGPAAKGIFTLFCRPRSDRRFDAGGSGRFADRSMSDRCALPPRRCSACTTSPRPGRPTAPPARPSAKCGGWRSSATGRASRWWSKPLRSSSTWSATSREHWWKSRTAGARRIRCRRFSRDGIARAPAPPRRRTAWFSTKCFTCRETATPDRTEAMSKLRAAMWSIAIGVLAVMLAAMLFRVLPAGGAVFVALLVACVALLSLLLALLVEVSPVVGAGGGAFGAILVAAVLGITIALAPLGLGAQRPQLTDLLWKPLFALIGVIAVCAAAGWTGVRLGLRLSRRARGVVRPPA